MIHDIDLASLAGREVEAVDAVGVPVLTPSVDIANARIRFAGGAVANITASRVSKERMRKIRFFQRSGYISLDLATGTGEFLRMRPGAGHWDSSQPAPCRWRTSSSASSFREMRSSRCSASWRRS